MAGSQKKVIVRLLAGGIVSGYLPSGGFVSEREVTLMDTAGHIIVLSLNDIKWIAYVKDFNLSDAEPERIGRKIYLGRPRGEGLWVRITLRDGDLLEGLAPSSLSFVDTCLEDRGIALAPPEVRSNTQRVYIPRSAMAAVEFIAVVATAAKRKVLDRPATQRQPGLFEDR